MGFEPTRAEHIGLAVQRLNHSATSSSWSIRKFSDRIFSKISETFWNLFFKKYGTPQGRSSDSSKTLPAWPEFDGQYQTYIELGRFEIFLIRNSDSQIITFLFGSQKWPDHHVMSSNLKRYCWKWRRIEATNLAMASTMCILERIYSWVVNRNRYQNDLMWPSWPRMTL